MILFIAISSDWPIHQLDVKNAFVHGTINETVYYQQPPGFVDLAHPGYVYKLNKDLYGLKQAPHACIAASRHSSHPLDFGVLNVTPRFSSSLMGWMWPTFSYMWMASY
jgi:hypothetical protein